MTASSTLRLFLLAAIWGFSFLFLRISVPSLGPGLMTFLRVLFAALFLSLFLLHIKHRFVFRAHLKYFLILGLINTALPFFLFSYAAQTLPSSLMAILNATVPSWGVIIFSLVNRKRPTIKVCIGLILGILGVAILLDFSASTLDISALPAILACLTATFCYASSSLYVKLNAHIAPYDNAHASIYCASIWLVPLLFIYTPNDATNIAALTAVFALGVVCTGVAYIIFFNLLQEIGEKVLTVTFLVPLFGVIWGTLILDERLSTHSFMGGLFIIAGTIMVVEFSITSWRSSRKLKKLNKTLS